MNFNIELNITEQKKEYTTYLTNILTPRIYEGIRGLYTNACDYHNIYLERGKNDPKYISPGELKIFQFHLKSITKLSKVVIEAECKRIKESSKTTEFFTDLLKATIKSNIVLLSFTSSTKTSEILKQNLHMTIDENDFIHKCYIESARLIYNIPDLFNHKFQSYVIKDNQIKIFKLIKKGILEAIRSMLPIKLIINEYINNDSSSIFNDNVNNIKSYIDSYLNDRIEKQKNMNNVSNELINNKTNENLNNLDNIDNTNCNNNNEDDDDDDEDEDDDDDDDEDNDDDDDDENCVNNNDDDDKNEIKNNNEEDNKNIRIKHNTFFQKDELAAESMLSADIRIKNNALFANSSSERKRNEIDEESIISGDIMVNDNNKINANVKENITDNSNEINKGYESDDENDQKNDKEENIINEYTSEKIKNQIQENLVRFTSSEDNQSKPEIINNQKKFSLIKS
jgi:hypothetical protein